MHTLTVSTPSKTYPIHIGEHLLTSLDEHILVNQVCIVTDEQIAQIYLEQVMSALELADKVVIAVTLPAGETAKNHDNLHRIYDALIDARFSRDAVLVALGGGVIGDMAGFAAATYQRGMGFVQVPTTLLAQVDSSVGGKVAVNHPKGKNMIGAFYQPDAVVIDTTTLTTLPAREINAGLAEVIKYGAIMDADFLTALEDFIPQAQAHDLETLAHIIATSCQHKADIVNADETEKGTRMLLNFGHTFGHAIEALTHYRRLLHGEAIAIGMMMAADLSHSLGYLQTQEVARLKSLFTRANLPTRLPNDIQLTTDEIYNAMFLDKKVRSGELTLILLKSLGKADIFKEVDEKEIKSSLDKYVSK